MYTRVRAPVLSLELIVLKVARASPVGPAKIATWVSYWTEALYC